MRGDDDEQCSFPAVGVFSSLFAKMNCTTSRKKSPNERNDEED